VIQPSPRALSAAAWKARARNSDTVDCRDARADSACPSWRSAV